jgi:hypothetical protein
MIHNIELIAIIIIFILLTTLSFVQVMELKYNLDLNNNIIKLNEYCSYNKNEVNINNIEIKKTFLWNISTYLFDFEQIKQNFKNIDNENTTYLDKYKDYKNLNRESTIVDGNENIMKIYNKYLYYTLPLFLFTWICFLFHIIFVNNINTPDTEEEYKYYIFYSIFYMFMFVVYITILFSLILKKITEIYADTYCYEYIMLMKEIDIIIKENREENSELLNILMSNNIKKLNSVSDIILTKNIIDELINYNKKITNTNQYIVNDKNYIFTLENVKLLYKYNSPLSINKINDEIKDITQYIYAYILIYLLFTIILSKVLKENYIYYLLSFIIMFLVILFIYNINKKIE